MAYDEELANRIRTLIGDVPGLTEKAMFGGLAFLINGNMSVAASSKGGLLLRVQPGETIALAKKPHASPMEMRGRPMEGWLRVAEAGVKTDKGLAPWVELSVAFARSLPPKDKSKSSMKKAAAPARATMAAKPSTKASKSSTKKAASKAGKPTTSRARR